jgi:hypothetical protein
MSDLASSTFRIGFAYDAVDLNAALEDEWARVRKYEDLLYAYDQLIDIWRMFDLLDAATIERIEELRSDQAKALDAARVRFDELERREP